MNGTHIIAYHISYHQGCNSGLVQMWVAGGRSREPSGTIEILKSRSASWTYGPVSERYPRSNSPRFRTHFAASKNNGAAAETGTRIATKVLIGNSSED
jgi:hypothetical protein